MMRTSKIPLVLLLCLPALLRLAHNKRQTHAWLTTGELRFGLFPPQYVDRRPET